MLVKVYVSSAEQLVSKLAHARIKNSVPLHLILFCLLSHWNCTFLLLQFFKWYPKVAVMHYLWDILCWVSRPCPFWWDRRNWNLSSAEESSVVATNCFPINFTSKSVTEKGNVIVVAGGRRRSVGVFMLKMGSHWFFGGERSITKEKWVKNKSSRRIGF